ncbi:MAG: hypothetical protein NTZ50_14510 [Chloroflexi bacterium]|nr:hypothetical protein [Chloroflexota bacterium]
MQNREADGAESMQRNQTPRNSSAWSDAVRRYLFAEDAEDVSGLVFITLTTLFSALLAVQLQTYTNDATRMRDRALQYALQAMGSRSRGELQSAYAWTDAYRLWLDWNGRALLADQRGDATAADRYRSVRDRATALSPLLGAKYFNPASAQAPNLRAYEADTYLVESTALSELYARTMDLCIRLIDKVLATTLQIVVLGVAIALVALAPKRALKHPILRRAPLATAALMVIAVVAWVVRIRFDMLPEYSDAAVARYAEGVGLQHQKRDAEAIAAFDAVLQSEPGYADALYRRGISEFALARYDDAARDFQGAWDVGREEVNVLWNLGWAQYIGGHFEDSIAATTHALTLAPDTPALLFNLGAVQLTSGDVVAARGSYGEGLKLVVAELQRPSADGAPPSTLWADLDTANHDLDALATCIAGGECSGAPPRQMISGVDTVQPTVKELRRLMKEASVSLEYARALPSANIEGSIGPLEFGSGQFDASGVVSGFVALGDAASPFRAGLAQDATSQQTTDKSVNIAAAGDAPVLVRFSHRGVRAGAQFVMKVNYDGMEAPWLRAVETWMSGADGERMVPLAPSAQFALAPGAYVVEMYLDGHLVQEGNFVLAAK